MHAQRHSGMNGYNSMTTTIMQSLTFTVFIVSENIATLKFLPYTDNRLASQPNTDHYIDSHFSCKSKKPGAAHINQQVNDKLSCAGKFNNTLIPATSQGNNAQQNSNP